MMRLQQYWRETSDYSLVQIAGVNAPAYAYSLSQDKHRPGLGYSGGAAGFFLHLQGFGDNFWPFIPCLRFFFSFFFLKWRLTQAH